MGVFHYDDNITTSGIDIGADPISLMAEDATWTVVSNGNVAHPDSVSTLDATPTVSTSCDIMTPSVANDIYSLAPMIVPTCEGDSVTFLRDDDDDGDGALLFDGFLNDNEDGSSIVAVDELLSLDRILGFDSCDIDLDDDWL